MTQKTKPRIVIDTNKHGIRRETNLDAAYNQYLKKKQKKEFKSNKPR
jgi:hypothetical protein